MSAALAGSLEAMGLTRVLVMRYDVLIRRTGSVDWKVAGSNLTESLLRDLVTRHLGIPIDKLPTTATQIENDKTGRKKFWLRVLPGKKYVIVPNSAK